MDYKEKTEIKLDRTDEYIFGFDGTGEPILRGDLLVYEDPSGRLQLKTIRGDIRTQALEHELSQYGKVIKFDTEDPSHMSRFLDMEGISSMDNFVDGRSSNSFDIGECEVGKYTSLYDFRISDGVVYFTAKNSDSVPYALSVNYIDPYSSNQFNIYNIGEHLNFNYSLKGGIKVPEDIYLITCTTESGARIHIVRLKLSSKVEEFKKNEHKYRFDNFDEIYDYLKRGDFPWIEKRDLFNDDNTPNIIFQGMYESIIGSNHPIDQRRLKKLYDYNDIEDHPMNVYYLAARNLARSYQYSASNCQKDIATLSPIERMECFAISQKEILSEIGNLREARQSLEIKLFGEPIIQDVGMNSQARYGSQSTIGSSDLVSGMAFLDNNYALRSDVIQTAEQMAEIQLHEILHHGYRDVSPDWDLEEIRTQFLAVTLPRAIQNKKQSTDSVYDKGIQTRGTNKYREFNFYGGTTLLNSILRDLLENSRDDAEKLYIQRCFLASLYLRQKTGPIRIENNKGEVFDLQGLVDLYEQRFRLQSGSFDRRFQGSRDIDYANFRPPTSKYVPDPDLISYTTMDNQRIKRVGGTIVTPDQEFIQYLSNRASADMIKKKFT